MTGISCRLLASKISIVLRQQQHSRYAVSIWLDHRHPTSPLHRGLDTNLTYPSAYLPIPSIHATYPAMVS